MYRVYQSVSIRRRESTTWSFKGKQQCNEAALKCHKVSKSKKLDLETVKVGTKIITVCVFHGLEHSLHVELWEGRRGLTNFQMSIPANLRSLLFSGDGKVVKIVP